MRPTLRWTMILVLYLALPFGMASADQFETLEGPVLARLASDKGSVPLSRLTSTEIGGLPILLKETRSALLVVKTDQGNYSRLLVTPELRKPFDGKGKPFPVLVLERFDTYDGGNTGSRLARGREIILFDGFQADLDTAQIVPEGQGGDLRFRVAGEGGPSLEALGSTKLFAPRTLPVPESGAVPQPTPGRRVVAGDFSGRYRLYANGQWSGLLDLKSDEKGEITGSFRSDLHGSSYVVTGQVASDSPQHVRFAVKFPRSQQDFDGYLWTEGKGAMAGIVSLLERTFGFFAIREGGRVAPETEIDPLDLKPGSEVVSIELLGEKLKLGGKELTWDELVESLRKLGPTEVTLRASVETRYAEVQSAIAACRATGVGIIRLGEAKPGQK